MSTARWPDHLLTLTEWEALPADPSHAYELVEGVLLVVPRPAPLHQRAMVRLAGELDRNLPRLAADDVLLAVEIVSPGTGRTDRVTKLVEYADAGIANYWIIELDTAVSLTAYTLVDGDYEHVSGGTGIVSVLHPAPVTLDLDALVSRR